MKKEMTMEQKAKKAEANKAYRARKKAKAETENWLELDKFEMSFTHKVRLFKNLKLEITNSYCASPGTVLKFEKLTNNDNTIVYRVRRTGRRTFFTTNQELKAPAV
jgi:hypothetical protein